MPIFNNILAGASGQAGGAAAGYEIERSLRFNSADSAYLNRTPSSAGNRKTFTYALWIKRGSLDSLTPLLADIFLGAYTDDNNRTAISSYLSDTDKFGFNHRIGGTFLARVYTLSYLRDLSAWYHIVVSVDSTASVASDRIKFYINGVNVTDTSGAIYPAQNTDFLINNTQQHTIGRNHSTLYSNGYLADVQFVDGQALAPTDFGEFDATTGAWNPIEYTFANNPNNGTTWSSSLTSSTGGFASGYAATAAFDGSTGTAAATSTGGGLSAYLTWSPTGFSSASHSLRIYTYSGYKIEVDSVQKNPDGSGGGGSAGWVDCGTISGGFSTVKVYGNSVANSGSAIFAVEVDGYVLIDGAGDNSFHLDFADNSTAAALGNDVSGNNNDWTVNNITTENPTTLPGVSFDGTNDYIESADDADYTFGSNDWTIECFVKSRDLSSHKAVVMKYSGTASTSSWWMSLLNGQISFFFYYGSGSQISGTTSSSITANVWSHLAVTRDGNTVRLYIDGVQSGTINVTGLTMNDTATPVRIAVDSQGNYDFNGIISNVRIVNGTCLYPSGTTFTVPTAPLTSVTNTKLLCCQSNSSVTTAAVSPNTLTSSGNAYAGTFSDSTGAEDSLRDSPTNGNTANDTGAGGEVPGNYCTWNPLTKGTYTNGNLDSSNTTSQIGTGTIGVSSGKWYWEVEKTDSGTTHTVVGATPKAYSTSQYLGVTSGEGFGIYFFNGNLIINGSGSGSYGAFSQGDILNVALDMDNGKVWFGKNGTWFNSGNPAAGTNALVTGLTGTYYPGVSNASGTVTCSANFGQRPFAYTAPSGFKALCTANLDDPTIADGSTAMDVALYTGTSSTQSITGLNFEPDFVWLKARSEVRSHHLFDVVRGATNFLKSDSTDAETTDVNTLTSFDSSGFSLGSSAKVNNNTQTYAGWAWDGGSSTVSNTDGSITSSVRANASAGFSIVTWTTVGSTGDYISVGHGLNALPGLVITKSRSNVDGWYTAHGFDLTQFGTLNTTNAFSGAGNAWGAGITSSVIGMRVGNFTANNYTHVAYCWAPVEGYSAFGSTTTNGTTDNAFVFTGFRPRFLIYKRSDSTGVWGMRDTARDIDNPDTTYLQANSSAAEGTGNDLDMLSNGFKIRSSNFASGATYIYAAFAENPFKYARAR